MSAAAGRESRRRQRRRRSQAQLPSAARRGTERQSEASIRAQPLLAEGMERDHANERDQDEREEDGEAVVHSGSGASVPLPPPFIVPCIRPAPTFCPCARARRAACARGISANAIGLAIGRLLGRLRLRLLLLERID